VAPRSGGPDQRGRIVTVRMRSSLG
jgi:hypothetical protein